MLGPWVHKFGLEILYVRLPVEVLVRHADLHDVTTRQARIDSELVHAYSQLRRHCCCRRSQLD